MFFQYICNISLNYSLNVFLYSFRLIVYCAYETTETISYLNVYRASHRNFYFHNNLLMSQNCSSNRKLDIFIRFLIH